MSKKFGAAAPSSVRAERRHPVCAWLALALCLAVVLFAPLFLTPSGSAQRTNEPGRSPQGPAAATRTTRNAALVAATDAVLKETSEIRQLSILHPVPSSTQSRAEIERALIKELNEDMTPTEMHAAEVTLKKLGLAPADFQYRALMIRVLTEQVAGYYDPKTRMFHLADWIDLDGQKPIMVHELTHALQDQHFNLRRFEHWPKGDSDAELAAHALIEGDATLTMVLYVANNPLRALAFLKSLGATGISSAELDKAPRALRETLLFPYSEGTTWTSSLYKRGGWGGVSQAFTDLPQSTEQVLHPEKYFAHEAPVKVTLPDISSALSTRHSVLRSWRRLDYDVQGEWGFYLLLDQFLKSPAESRRAAAGWGGDRFEVYEGPHSEACFISLSVWDTENDAREFFKAYVKRTQLRYPDAARMDLPASEDQTRNPQLETRNSYSRRTSEGTVVIELRGNRVLILEGVPDRVDSNALRRSLWQS
jgi:hypothetical protein